MRKKKRQEKKQKRKRRKRKKKEKKRERRKKRGKKKNVLFVVIPRRILDAKNEHDASDRSFLDRLEDHPSSTTLPSSHATTFDQFFFSSCLVQLMK